MINLLKIAAVLFLLLASVPATLAQSRGQEPTGTGRDGRMNLRRVQRPEPAPQFDLMSLEMRFDQRLVKGAPYSAEIVNEFVQTLANGNRIVRRTSSHSYRDSQGRTRREQTAAPIAMAGIGGEWTPSKTTIITDNVDGSVYILDEQNKTARRIKMGQPGQFNVVPDGNSNSVISTGGRMMVLERETATATLNHSEEIVKKINVAGGVLQGSALTRVQPVYPPEAKAANVTGPVTVKISISETGDVTSAEATSGHPLLREAAVTAARQWKS